MKRLLEFKDGIIVEVEDTGTDQGPVSSGRAAAVQEKVEKTFYDALDRIQPIANAVVTKLRDVATTPDEVAVEFGIKFTAKADFILSAGTEANLKITLKWKPGAPSQG